MRHTANEASSDYRQRLPAACLCLAMDQGRQRHKAIAVERVVGAKRNDMPAWQNMTDAALHDEPHIKVVDVQKGDQHDPKHVLAGELFAKRFCHEIIERATDAAVRPAATATGYGGVLFSQGPNPLWRVDDAVGDQVAVFFDVNHTGNRHGRVTAPVDIAHHVAIGMCAWERTEIAFPN